MSCTFSQRHLDWDSAAYMLKGVYSTLSRFLFVAHLPHLKVSGIGLQKDSRSLNFLYET